MKILEEFSNNPFQPGFPVSSNNFKGRNDDINEIIRYLPRVIAHGKTEYFFITGNWGVGKTSFIKHVGNIAEEKYGMIPLYINNEGTNTIHVLIQKLLDKLFKKFNKESWGQKFVKTFVNYFDEINIADFNFKFKDNPQIVDDIKENFAEFLVVLSNNMGDKNGVFIIIDDVNGLSNTPKFVNWYKALFETLDFDNEFVPITFSLVNYPAKFD